MTNTLRAACTERHCPRRATCQRYRALRLDDPWQPRVAGAERGVGCSDYVPLDGRVLRYSSRETDAKLDAQGRKPAAGIPAAGIRP